MKKDVFRLMIQRFNHVNEFVNTIGFTLKRKQEKSLNAVNIIKRLGSCVQAVNEWKKSSDRRLNRKT